MALSLRLLGRPACHLCLDMLAVLLPFMATGQVMLELVDLDTDEGLASRYALFIPVLLTQDGEEIAHYTLNEAQVLAALAGG